MAGLLDMGLGLRQDAIEGFGDLGNMEVQRRKENAQLKAQAENARGQMIGSIVGALASAGVNAIPQSGKGAAGSASNVSIKPDGAPALSPDNMIGLAAPSGVGEGAINLTQGQGKYDTFSGGRLGQSAVNMSSMQGASTPHWLDIFPDY